LPNVGFLDLQQQCYGLYCGMEEYNGNKTKVVDTLTPCGDYLSKEIYTDEYVKWLEKRVKQLKAKAREYRLKLDGHASYTKKQYQQDQDYLPYEDDIRDD